MKIRILLLAAWGLFSMLSAQNLDFSATSIDFGSVNVGSASARTLTITNNDSQPVTLTAVNYSNGFTPENTSITIPALSDYDLDINFTGTQNVEYDDTLVLYNDDLDYAKAVHLTVQARYSDTFYTSTYNLWDGQLLNALSTLVANHTALSYEAARTQIFGYIDNVNNQVQCVYTGVWYDCTHGQDPDWDILNTEHTWPQSMGATGNAKSDMHHLFPTNASTNSLRGNLPFGVVVNANWQGNGSKRGTNASGVTVFEPRDVHKGDCARAMLYFSTRYDNPSNFLASAGQEATFRVWNAADPVSAQESARNIAIEAIQHKPNPYVEHPEFVDRIYDFCNGTNRPQTAHAQQALQNIQFGSLAIDETTTRNLVLVNSGNATMTITATVSGTGFAVGSYTTTVLPGAYSSIPVSFTPTAGTTYSGALQITTNGGNFSLPLTGSGTTAANNNVNMAIAYNVFPNPVRNGSIKLRSNAKPATGTLARLYDVRGRMVLSRELNSDNTALATGKLANGLYFIKISAPDRSVSVKKITIME